MAHPWHDIPLPSGALEPFPAVIEIPKGEKNKYELDKETGFLRVDRVLFAAMHYPANYGFIPRTLGGFRMRDEKGPDEKIICVHVNDPAVADYQSTTELPRHVVRELLRFFEDYKTLEEKEVEVGLMMSKEEALEQIRASAARYQEAFAGRRR